MLKDNFLNKKDFVNLYNAVTSPFMPYFVQNGCASEEDGKPLMTHKIIDLDQKIHSSAYDIVAKPILEKLNAFRILRLKINCYPNSGNTALLFDGKEEHRSISQTDTLWRFNINIDYE